MSKEGKMEDFDADVDCITGKEIPVEYVLTAALKEPFDGIPNNAPGWGYHAALAVLKDLSWRNGVGRVLKDCDAETRLSLTQRLCDIIVAASDPTFVDLSDSLTVSRLEATKLESEVSRLSLELQEQTQRRIELEYQLGDAKAKPVSLNEARIRLTLAKARLLEAQAADLEGEAV